MTKGVSTGLTLGYDPFMLTQFPTSCPTTPLLDRIEVDRVALHQLSEEQLLCLADEVRQFLLYSVSGTGGHFGAGLGVVELTIALHHVFNTPHDRLVWDVGHQTYAHKIGKASVTGYCIKFKTLNVIDLDVLEAAILEGVEITSKPF